MITSDRALVKECHVLVEHLCGELVELEHAERLEKVYRPPRTPGARRRTPNQSTVTYSPLWLVRVFHEDWDEEDYEHHEKARSRAQKRIKPGLERLDQFSWVGAPLAGRLERGHLVIQVIKEGRTTYLYPPAHVVEVEPWKSHRRNARRMLVYLTKPRGKQRRRRPDVVTKLGSMSSVLTKLETARLVRRSATAGAMLRIWNHPAAQRR